MEISALPFVLREVEYKGSYRKVALYYMISYLAQYHVIFKKSWVLTSLPNFIKSRLERFQTLSSSQTLSPTTAVPINYFVLYNLCTGLDWTDSSRGYTYVDREARVSVASKPRIHRLHISKTTSNAFTAILDIITTQCRNLLGVSL